MFGLRVSGCGSSVWVWGLGFLGWGLRVFGFGGLGFLGLGGVGVLVFFLNAFFPLAVKVGGIHIVESTVQKTH